MEHRVAVLPHVKIAGLKPSNPTPRSAARVMRLRDALTHRFASDAHCVAYVVPDCQSQPRINKPGLALWGGETPMVSVFFCDSDNPGKRRWGDELLAQAEREYRELDVLKTCAIYHTNHGRRFVQPLTRPIPVQDVEPYLQAWLSSLQAAGIEVDGKCKDWTRLFRLPYVIRNGKPTEPGVFDLERMRPIEPPVVAQSVLDAYRERKKPKKQRRRVAQTDDTWRDEVLGIWRSRIPIIARSIPSAMGERHELYLCLAGAISRHLAPADLPAIVHAIALAAGDDEPEDRRKTAETTAERILSGDAIKGMRRLRETWPAVASALDDATAASNEAAVRAEARSKPRDEVLSINAASQLVRDSIANAPDGVSLVSAECGLGKTHAAQLVAVARAGKSANDNTKRAPLNTKTSISVDKHALAKQVTDNVRARSCEARRIFGPLSMLDGKGKPVCIYAEQAAPLVAGGQSLQFAFCEGGGGERCPHFDDCLARLGAEGPDTARVQVGPHALLSSLQGSAGKTGLLVIDEPPDMLETVTIRRGDLELARRGLTAFSSFFSDAISPALDVLAEQLDRAADDQPVSMGALFGDAADPTSPAGVFGTAQSEEYDGKPPPLTLLAINRAKASSGYAGQLGRASSVLHMLKRVLEGNRAMCRVEQKGDERLLLVTMLNKQLDAALRREGATVLTDANAELHVPILAKVLGYAPPLTRASAEDGAPIERTILLRRKCTRKHWTPFGRLSVSDGLVRSVRKAFAWASDSTTRSIGIISYRLVELAIRGAAEPANENIDGAWQDASQAPEVLAEARERLGPIVQPHAERLLYGHYGGLRGLDYMKDADALITLGDPWPNLGDVKARVAFLDLEVDWEEHALALTRAELEQAHGRLRTIHRQRPGRALHVGYVLPGGPKWAGNRVSVRADRGGRAAGALNMSIDELQTIVTKLGGNRATAKLLGRSPALISAWRKGAKLVSHEDAHRLRGLSG